jgi:D-beta-D-heptose 7-phosphate kinase/D-beta-D-heptose 1-phosphate adenosyltransferase
MRIIINGVFDLLHSGHLKLLKHARSYKDSEVLVLIDSDQRVKDLKGPTRPIINQEDRKLALESLRYVDQVKIFNSDDELEALIKDWNPKIMVKGTDYIGKEIIGAKYCGVIDFFDIDEKYSTTKLVQRIINR